MTFALSLALCAWNPESSRLARHDVQAEEFSHQLNPCTNFAQSLPLVHSVSPWSTSPWASMHGQYSLHCIVMTACGQGLHGSFALGSVCGQAQGDHDQCFSGVLKGMLLQNLADGPAWTTVHHRDASDGLFVGDSCGCTGNSAGNAKRRIAMH